jgi:UTP-glucose-1-phosphate uridylyltransferase
MSISTVFEVQEAIKKSHQYDEVQALVQMLAAHRLNTEISEDDYFEGLGMLVSVASAAATNEVVRVFMGDDELELMTNEYQEVVMTFNNIEEENN